MTAAIVIIAWSVMAGVICAIVAVASEDVEGLSHASPRLRGWFGFLVGTLLTSAVLTVLWYGAGALGRML